MIGNREYLAFAGVFVVVFMYSPVLAASGLVAFGTCDCEIRGFGKNSGNSTSAMTKIAEFRREE
jgi:hypothetical protein